MNEKERNSKPADTLAPQDVGPAPYAPPLLLHTFQLEALAVLCTDTNAKADVAFGCNPGALFS